MVQIKKTKLLCVFALALTAAMVTVPAHAALITFDAVVAGATSFGFDGDGDTFDDVIFTTTDPGGFNTVGPGPNQLYIDEPGLEGTTLLNPDLRVDFLVGAEGSITFGFAMNSVTDDLLNSVTFELFDAGDVSLGSATVVADIFALGGGLFSLFVEGEVSIAFAGTASYGLFNFQGPTTSRYIIDNLEGTFGTTEMVVPEPATMTLLGIGLVGFALRRRKMKA